MFGWFKKKKSNYRFTDEDRELSAAKRRAKAAEVKRQDQLEQLKHDIEIEELKMRLDDIRGVEEEADNYNLKAFELFASIVGVGKQQPQQTTQTTAVWDDMQIIATIEQFEKQFGKKKVAMFKQLPKNIQALQIKAQLPQLSDETVERAIELLANR